MNSENPLPQMGKDALDLWNNGELEAAAELFQKILALAAPDYIDLPHYHGCYGGVLAALGHMSSAQEQFELAVIAQLREDKNAFSSGVIVARYFLAEHLLQINEPLKALEVVAPSLQPSGVGQWLLLSIQAQACALLGREPEARSFAQGCLDAAPSAQKREELKTQFATLNIL